MLARTSFPVEPSAMASPPRCRGGLAVRARPVGEQVAQPGVHHRHHDPQRMPVFGQRGDVGVHERMRKGGAHIGGGGAVDETGQLVFGEAFERQAAVATPPRVVVAVSEERLPVAGLGVEQPPPQMRDGGFPPPRRRRG